MAPSVKTFLAMLHRAERAIVILAFCGMVSVVFADVLARELTGVGLPWARQVGVYFNIFVVLFGIGLASASASHLRPRFADGWLPARWEPQVGFLTEAVFAMFCLCFAIVSLGVVIESVQLDERSEIIRMPIWPVQAMIPMVFLIAAIRHAIYASVPSLRPMPPATSQADG